MGCPMLSKYTIRIEFFMCMYLQQPYWLVVSTPKNMSSSVGICLFHSQLFLESHEIPWFQTTNQWLLTIINHYQ